MFETIKKYAKKYPLSVLCIIIIWLLSLAPFFPETPLDNIKFIDKWTHLVMYGGTCCVIWWEYWRQHQYPDFGKLYVWAWGIPIIMSGVLELLQEYATVSRNGDWYDLTANASGATLAAILGTLLVKFFPRR